MRNLNEYPITADETINSLKWALREYTRNIQNYGVGGIEGIAMLLAEKFIEENKEQFNKFSKRQND